MQTKTKKMFLLIIIFSVLALAVGGSLIYAYLSQSVVRDYGLEIQATNVTFKFNDMTYLDEIRSENIVLYKGENTDVEMKIEVTGTSKLVVSYNIGFTVENVGADSEAFMPAIEVYREVNSAVGAKYEYLCRLSEIEDLDGGVLGGVMVTNYVETIPLRFVYSAASGDVYDKYVTDGDIDFSIKAHASASLTSESASFVYASTTAEFERVFQAETSAGKTIMLAGDDGTNFIEVNSPLASKGLVGIDLNGRTLKLNSTLTVNRSGSEGGVRLGITNSKTAGGLDTLNNNCYIWVPDARNCYLIDNSIASVGVTAGKVRVNFHYGNYEAITNDFAALVKERGNVLNDGSVYAVGTDVSILFKDIYGYTVTFSSFGSSSDSAIKEELDAYDNRTGSFIIAINSDLTSKYSYSFYLSYAGILPDFNDLDSNDDPIYKNVSTSRTISGYVTVRGNSARAIADAFNAQIPELISGSQFFPTHDSTTGAYIDWIVDDRMGGELLDSSGVYRKNGLNAILGTLADGCYDKNVYIYIKVTKGADTSGEYADEAEDGYTNTDGDVVGDGVNSYQHKAVTVSAKERTALVFKGEPVTVSMDDTYDIYSNYLNVGYISKVGLVGIKIDESSMTLKINNVNVNPGDFLTVNKTNNPGVDGSNKEATYNTISVTGSIPVNTLNPATFNVIFTYQVDSSGGTRDYVINKEVIIAGGYSDVTKYDMTYTLQSAFVGNAYTEGTDNWFYAYGALRPMVNGVSVAVLADYTVEGAAANYISVTYVFLNVEDSLDGLTNEQVAYFILNPSGAYEYIDDIEGEHPYENRNIRTSDLYERKALIEVLYARITTVDQVTAYFSVSLYTIDKEAGSAAGETDYVDASGNVIYGWPHYGYSEWNAELGYNELKELKRGETLSGQVYKNSNGEFVSSVAFKVYKDPTTGALRKLDYYVSLEIIGIIRNNSSQVVDLQLYIVYLAVFDVNKDNVLTSKEAEDWDTVKSLYGTPGYAGTQYLSPYISQLDGKTYYYINLSGLSISSLKGVEYFLGVEGYNLTNTGRINISALSVLTNMVYLNLNSNTITDLAPLQYLDNLEYLSVYNNRITSIEAIRYLSKLTYLDLSSSASSGFNVISSYEPLGLMTNLRTLNVTYLYINNTGLGADGVTMYYFSLLTATCNSITDGFVGNWTLVNDVWTRTNGDWKIYIKYNLDITVTTEMEVAALVMRDLENMNRVNSTLYMPTYYYYYNSVEDRVIMYRLYWYTDKNETNLVLSYNTGDPTVKYTVISPIQDRKVNLFVKVYKNTGAYDPANPANSESYDLSREFILTLEASYTAQEAYIYDWDKGIYIKAKTAIPDEALRTELFSMFNYNTDTGTLIEVESGIFVSELYVISRADMQYYSNTTTSVKDLSYLGIKSLEGIGYFYQVLRGELILTGNSFPSKDLLYLGKLSNVTSLTLGGAYYDFYYLLYYYDDIDYSAVYGHNVTPHTTTNAYGTRYRRIMSGLTTLYVTECYGLEDENTLAALYEIYCSFTGTSTNMGNIYLTSTSAAWNPYTKVLAQQVSQLKDTVSYYKYGETFNVYTKNGGYETTNTALGQTQGIPLSIYNTTAYAAYVSGTVYYNNTSSTISTSTTISTTTYLYHSGNGNLVYVGGFGAESSANASITIRFFDRRATNVDFYYYYLQIIVADGGEYIDVYDSDINSGTYGKYLGTLSDVVASYDLKSAALTRLYLYIETYWTTRNVISINSLFSGSLSGGYFYPLSAAGTTVSYINYRGRIAVSTAIFGNIYGGTIQTAVNSYAMGQFTYSTSSALPVRFSISALSSALSLVTYTGECAVAGLQYFTTITTLNIYADTNFGNGEGLKNIQTLNLYRMAVDFSTITTELPALQTILIQHFIYFDAGVSNANGSAFQYFTGLRSFTMQYRTVSMNARGTTRTFYWVNDFTFLEDLVDPVTGAASLTTLVVYDLNGTTVQTTTISSGATTITSATSTMGTSPENAAAVKKVYAATFENSSSIGYNSHNNMSYRIGSPTLHSDTGYFYAINNSGTYEAWYSPTQLTNLTIGNVTEMWGEGDSSSTLEVTDATNFSLITGASNMKDMGLSYNQNTGISNDVFWIDNKNYSTDSTITKTISYNGQTKTLTDTVSEKITLLNSGADIYLPASTVTAYYGLIFGGSAADEVENNRDYRIKWDVYIINSVNRTEEYLVYNGNTGAVDVSGSTGTNTSGTSITYNLIAGYYKYEDKLKISFLGNYENCYISIIGTLITSTVSPTINIRDGVTRSNVVTAAYSFWYEFKVGDGDGIYTYNATTDTGVRDFGLRMWLFAKRNTYQSSTSTETAMAISGSGSYGSIRKLDMYGTAFMNYSSYLPTEGSYSAYAHIKSVSGITDVTDYWGATERIISLSILYGSFNNISPLFGFENLATLNLNSTSSNTSYLQYNSFVKLTESITPDGKDIYTYMNTLPGNAGIGAFKKLATLNLSYCYSITPEDIELFSKTARASLATLNLYYTRCMYNYEVIPHIKTIIDNTALKNGSRYISLSLNYSSTENIQDTHINNFLNLVNTSADYPSGITADSTLYRNGTEQFNKTFTYNYTISTETLWTIKNRLVAKNLSIRLQITTSAQYYRQFTNVYTTDATSASAKDINFYNDAVTADLRFGTSGLTAENFDTEVLAYMFYNYGGRTGGTPTFTNSSGNYVYTASGAVTLNSSSIKYLKKNGVDAGTLLRGTGGGTISLNTTYYSPAYALSYAEGLPVSLAATDRTSSTYAYSITYTQSFQVPTTTTLTYLGYIKTTFTFVGTQPEYIAQLPNYIYFRGQAKKIIWDVGSYGLGGTTGTYIDYYSFNGQRLNYPGGNPIYRPALEVNGDPTVDATLQRTNWILYQDISVTGHGYTYLILNETTLTWPNGAGYFTDNFRFGRNVEYLNSDGATTSNSSTNITITLTRNLGYSQSTDYAFIEVEIDGNGYAVFQTLDPNKPLYYYIGNKFEVIYKKADGRYYNYGSQEEKITVINANQVFDSDWLIRYMYTTYFTTAVLRSETTSTATTTSVSIYGYIMTQSAIAGMTELDIRHGAGTGTVASNNRSVTSIEGVQIFYNMKSFIARTGMFSDISPLVAHQLETFYYSPIGDYSLSTTFAPAVTDFSPLLRASKTTLKYFTYNGTGMGQMLDMSFLLGLKELKEVYIASAYPYSYLSYHSGSTYYENQTYTSPTNVLSYFMTSAGRYLINALAEKNVYIYTYSNTAGTLNPSGIYFANLNLSTGRTALTVDANNSSVTRTLQGNIAGYSTLYALKASVNDGFAYNVLKQYMQDNRSTGRGVTYNDGYLLTVNTAVNNVSFGSEFYDGVNYKLSSVTFDIASTIVGEGGFYLIDWESAGANTVINGYYLTRALTINGVTYNAGTYLTAGQVTTITNSLEYYNAYKTGQTQLRTSVTVLFTEYISEYLSIHPDDLTDAQLNEILALCTNARATGSITLNDYGYSRMFTFAFTA